MTRKFVENAFATGTYACCRACPVEHIHGDYYRLPTGEIREYMKAYDTAAEAVEAGRDYLRKVRCRINKPLGDDPHP